MTLYGVIDLAILLSIVSGNGLLTNGSKALLGKILTYCHWDLWEHLDQWNLNKNYNSFIQEMEFAYVVCRLAAILHRPQCVKMIPGCVTLFGSWIYHVIFPCDNRHLVVIITQLRFYHMISGVITVVCKYALPSSVILMWHVSILNQTVHCHWFEACAKWLLFCRQHFQMHFLE